MNEGVCSEESKENDVSIGSRTGYGEGGIQWQDTGIMQVSAETREKIIQNQKDAMLRKRRQQLQSGFIRSINVPTTTTRLGSDPHIVPTVKTYYSTSKQLSVGTKENLRKEPLYLNINSRPTKANCDDIDANDKTYLRKCRAAKYQEKVQDRNENQVAPNETVPTTGNSFPEYTIQSHNINLDEEKNKRTNKQLKRSPSLLTNERHSQSEEEDVHDETNRNDSMEVELNKYFPQRKQMISNQDVESPQKRPEDSISAKTFFESVDWDDIQEVRKMLLAPCPKEVGMVKCYIRRFKGKAKMFPEYRVYLQDGDKFLMTSKKRAKKKSSNYLISLERNDHNKNSPNIIGKLRANFLGTEFQIYDNGKNPKHLDPFFDENNNEVVRSELGAILYSTNIIGNRQPRKMQVCINRVSHEGGSMKQWQPAHKDEEMIQNLKHKSQVALQHLHIYENRQPKWNEDLASYVLNFNKRVNLASVKNFQLIQPNNEEKIILQFGKASHDEFIMDVQWPMSLFQAFAISLSSFDSKIACD